MAPDAEPAPLSLPMARQMRRMSRCAKANVGNTIMESLESLTSCDGKVVMQDRDGPAYFEKTLNVKPEERDPAAARSAMEWWLRTLPVSGFELAPELQAEPWVLFEIFCCGRLASCTRNQVIQEEGEPVQHYTIILFGQCKLRCAKPAVAVAPIVPVIDNAKEDAKGRDADAFIHVDTLGRGESIGLLPGDPRSPYHITCADKTLILRLTAQDYDATLRPYHKQFFGRTVDFLQQHNVCPDAGAAQLKKIAPFLRQRRIPRGKMFLQSGECQRHFYVLREGSCAVLVHDDPEGMAGTVPLDEEEDDGEEEEDKHDKFIQQRASSYGARMQQQSAYDEKRRDIMKSMARGPMKKTLAGSSRHAFKMSDGDLQASATLSEPGMMLGEEAFAYDTFRDWVTLRNCYSVRTTSKCSFYVADITAFKLFNTYMGSGDVTQMLNEKLTRRCKQFTRGKNVTKRINKRAQEMMANELAKLSRQQLRLPKCAGYPAVDELESVDDYLDVVMDHRKAPPETQLPTLTCLEGTVYGPKHNANGPGVSAMLKEIAEEGGIIRGRSRSHSRLLRDYRESSSYDENPMGGTVPVDARYKDAAPSGFVEPALAIQDGQTAKALTRGESLPELASCGWAGGVFLNTEVSFDDGMTISFAEQSVQPLPHSTSLPDLTSPHQISKSESSKVTVDTSSKASRSDAQSVAMKRHQRIMKSFNKVMPGRSVLTLTDKKDLQKQIARVLLSDATSLAFTKTTNDLWAKLRESKDSYDVLLIDLTKNELQIEPLIRTVRSIPKYSQVPIVVLSMERDLPEAVRNSCSFVVFLPLAASMLREALVWCFDRKAVQKLYQSDESQELQVLTGKAPVRSVARALVDATLIA